MRITFFIIVCLFLSSGCTMKNSTAEDKNEELQQLFITNLIYSGSFTFPPSIVVLNDKNQHIRLDSIFESEKLVLRFTYSSCENCILSELENLKTLPSNLKSKVILLISYQSPRILKIIKNKYAIEFPIYFIDEKIAGLIFPSELNNLTQPYLFWTDLNLTCTHIYIPSVSYPEISKNFYYELLNKSDKHSSHIFLRNLIDFGEIEINKEYKFQFTYKNPESYPLIINDIKPTCGCTVVDWDRSPLIPGATSKLTIKLTPNQEGYLFKKIFINYNKNKTTTIAVKGIVK